IQMPEMDGHEACRQIRKAESESNKKRTPVIAMTAHAMKEDRDKCLAAGMDDYVAKPIDAKALLEVLELWLPKKKPVTPPVLEPDPVLTEVIKGKDNLKVFDQEALMDRMMDDTELFEMIIVSFLEDMPKQMDVLINHINQKNSEDAGKQGHQIKGVAGNVGADVCREIASEIEIAGKTGDLDELILLVPQLEDAFDQLKKAMEKKI
ncbi:MAG: response regulator, partial [Desulfobacteraceae bacterium]|nr:response regulator [Desulfobacteraceae bacterium]